MAKKKTNTKKSLSNTQKVEIGVGLTAAALTAAGAYFLYGSSKASKNRKQVKSWMLRAKAEVLEGLEKAEDMTEDEFGHLVATVSDTYGKLKDASNIDIADFKREMKENWPKIVKEGKKVTRTVSKVVGSKTKKSVPAKKKTTAKKTVTKKSAAKKTKQKTAQKK